MQRPPESGKIAKVKVHTALYCNTFYYMETSELLFVVFVFIVRSLISQAVLIALEENGRWKKCRTMLAEESLGPCKHRPTFFPSSIFFQSVMSYSIIKYKCYRDQSHGQRAMSSTCMRNMNDTECGKGAIMKRHSTEQSKDHCLQAQLIYRRDLDKELVA